MSIKKIMIMAAGTGGHVIPALSVARALSEHNIEVCWLGTSTGIEVDLVPKAGIKLTRLDIQGLRGQGFARLLFAPFKILAAILAARKIIKDEKVDLVLGFGGYVTGPGGVAARSLGIPLVIHEQNAIAGFTNRLLAKIARDVLLAFPQALAANKKTQWVGNPVRVEIAHLEAPAQRFSEHHDALRIVVLGGSQGAVALNELVPEALKQVSAQQDIQIKHQAGKKNWEKTQQTYQTLNLQADVLSFVDDMASLLSWADVVICRSGALTVSELAAGGIASVLIPYPYAVDDHQTANGAFLQKVGAAKMFAQKDLTAARLAQELLPILNRETLQKMAEQARTLAQPQATERVVAVCLTGDQQ
jgi:UDP-N-acetylglucosamine--N-acetylmuramyl-(pentapeptide) pyrophosphoryl-undecaprenol N-acetylglucosamine transferase